MGYLKIPNLYKDQTILMFRECYAMEKVHGTSAHVSFNEGGVRFFAGGESHDKFVAVFDVPALTAAFQALGHPKIIIFGEAYGGKCQGMSGTYGKDLHFIAFDVKVDETWLAVPDAHDVCTKLGLEFVPYLRVSTDPAALDAARDRWSEVATRRGCGEGKIAEGVVLRPLFEFRTSSGDRVIAKHKRPEFSERASKRDTTLDPGKAEILIAAEAIAAEWVTPMRAEHVAARIRAAFGIPKLGMVDTGLFLTTMEDDVYTEGKGEVVKSREVSKAIRTHAAKLFKKMANG